MAAAILVAVLGMTAPTRAYLAASSNEAVNQFQNTTVTCAVSEQFDGAAKTIVKLQNTGDIPAYLRSRVLVTWKNADGQLHWQKPQPGTDFTMTLDLANGWMQHTDGYYYWQAPVEPLGFTGVLIPECRQLPGRAPEGFRLSVEILGDAIQSEPDAAVLEAWGLVPGKEQVSGG